VFTVYLPLATAAYSAAGTSQSPRVTAVRTVVVVEDQEDAREMMKILLETKGLTVHVAADGREGADLIRRVQPDLALVDLGLPVVSGYDLARTLRGSDAAPHTRLVALSGYGRDSDVQAALDAGFDQHLTKPPDFQKLDALLQPTDQVALDPCDDGSA
jgi:two-component system CheB/CheR fusion protein